MKTIYLFKKRNTYYDDGSLMDIEYDKFLFEYSTLHELKEKLKELELDIVIGDNVVIGDYATIERMCNIGNNVSIGFNSCIKIGSTIGDNCIIKNDVFIDMYSVIGKNVNIDMHACILGNIKDNVNIGHGVRIDYDEIIENDILK